MQTGRAPSNDTYPNLIDGKALAQAIATRDKASACRMLVRRMQEGLKAAFSPEADIAALVRARAAAIDTLLINIWPQFRPAHAEVCLIAAGGYGRGELHPASDIDIMLLCGRAPDEEITAAAESFLAFLWDIGLEIGHSVRTVDDCAREAAADITVATALMEARLLEGNAQLFRRMLAATGPEHIWPSREFFKAKLAEQQERHARYQHTAHRLEPNIKGTPGGLRDIQTIAWVARRHFGATTLAGLVDHGFLTLEEYEKLENGQRFLWRIRFALHLLYGRREERLLFDAQLKLARQFGYADAANNLAVEQFMQRYYRTVTELSRLNEMLLELFEEEILLDREAEPEYLNPRFQVRHGFLETTGDEVFRKHPSALLELFYLLQQHPDIKGVSPSTIRQLRRDRELIDDAFRAEPENRALFMRILREPQGVTHELRRMNRYGILGRYIPAFGNVAGRMQYDLFHAYTVDEHILFVVSNLRRFALPRFDHEFPYCSRIMQALVKPEIAYLAGLFHDIAKGRGGDHSELGAVDAEEFCLEHGLSKYDARMVAWLVRHHLLLSVTAQKKDIADPKVIHEFAETVGDELHLDYLYVLTVADVRGTNPELWNSWKARLFRDLYENTQRALRRGLGNPIDTEELIRETKEAAFALLAESGLDVRRAAGIWQNLNPEYFLRHAPDEIAWQTRELLDAGNTRPIVSLRRETQRGGTAVFVCGPDDSSLFASVTATLDQLGLTVMDARVITVGPQQVIHTYSVLEDNGAPIDDPLRERQIIDALRKQLGGASRSFRVSRRTPRQVRMFDTPTHIVFDDDERNDRTVLEITASDQPGLLSNIGRAFMKHKVRLQNAKIMTVGERAEDVFFITGEDERALDEESRRQLRDSLLDQLNNNSER